MESLSAYARQFLGSGEARRRFDRGLSPAISIEQRATGSNPRSTIGTVTEICDYRACSSPTSAALCIPGGKEIASQSPERIVDMVMLQRRTSASTSRSIARPQGEFKKELAGLRVRGLHQSLHRRPVPSLEGT
jgi:excinuclease ABC subunit A